MPSDRAARRRRGRWAALGAVLALVLPVAACGAGDGAPLWTLDGRTISGGDFLKPRIWAAGPTLAITRATEVTGYDAATGERRWSVPLSGRVCAASPRADGDRVAVQFGPGRQRCDRIAAVDLKSGRKLWEQPMPTAERVREGQVVISGGVVVVDESSATAAFRLADGEPLWNRDSRGADCAMKGLASGPALVAGFSCDGDRGKARRVDGIDPDSGRSLWSYVVPQGYSVATMPSSRPVVLGLKRDGSDKERTQYVVLDESGAQITSIDVTGRFSVRCYQDPNRCNNVVVSDDSLYIRTNAGPVKDEKERTFAPIVSFDLATGRARWSTENPDGNHLFPIGMDGGRLIAAQPKTGRYKNRGRRPRLVSVDPASGRTSVMWEFSRKADFALRSGSDRLYANGRLFLVEQLVSGNEDRVFSAFAKPAE